jgi:rod shape-determining protein MreC
MQSTGELQSPKMHLSILTKAGVCVNWFQFRLKNLILFGVALILPLVSLNMQKRPTSEAWFESPFEFIAGNLQNGFFQFNDGVRGLTTNYLNLINIRGESQSLRSEMLTLKAKIKAFDELEMENIRLSGLLDFKARNRMSLQAARVISRDLLTDHSTVRINKGSHHGLQAGQAVISTEGVVGHILRAEAFTSFVLLITDRYSVVDGILSRSRARGIVEGRSPGTCSLLYVERTEDVKTGDLVVTSGLDNIFPKGYPIAVVEAVEAKSYAGSLRVDLRPVVDPNKIEEVFVIMNSAYDDMTDQFAHLYPVEIGAKKLRAE